MQIVSVTQHSISQQPVPAVNLAEVCALPLFVSRIPAGFPSPAADYTDGSLDLNTYLVQNKAASYYFEVKGDSMKNVGIMDGDKVLVDRSIEPRHGKIVIASVDGEFTIKKLYRRAGRVELRPENPAFDAIVVGPETQLEIWGVVVGSVRRYIN